jgi:saccharopine dehydrogenase-like NADP-dependent oxidoreductase
MAPGEADQTIFQVIVEGRKDGQGRRYTYELLDKYDAQTDISSMARTTGYTCTIVARQVLGGLFSQKGICPPEYVGRTPGCFEDLLAGYEERNIQLSERVVELDN